MTVYDKDGMFQLIIPVHVGWKLEFINSFYFVDKLMHIHKCVRKKY